jgi:hypothetical protein
VSATAGPLLFARYAYPPNSLGLCGADVRQTVLQYGAAGESDGGLAELARTFEGAWPYLELIAGASGIADPLDPRVVQAYWVGNELLGRVTPTSLAHHVEDRFRGRLGRAREHVLDAVAAGAVPHHCFHVFAVYPWLGLLRSGVVDAPLRVLELCRTTPAVVESVDGETVSVLARPLRFADGELLLGQPERRRARWRNDGLAFVRTPTAGDHVSLHWDFVCDVLTPREARTLAHVTDQALAAVNRSAPPTGSRRRERQELQAVLASQPA